MISKIFVKDNSSKQFVEVKRVKSLKNMDTKEILLSGFGMFR